MRQPVCALGLRKIRQVCFRGRVLRDGRRGDVRDSRLLRRFRAEQRLDRDAQRFRDGGQQRDVRIAEPSFP